MFIIALRLPTAQRDIFLFSIFQDLLQRLRVVVQGGEEDGPVQHFLPSLILLLAAISGITAWGFRTEKRKDSQYEVILPVVHGQVEQLALHHLSFQY